MSDFPASYEGRNLQLDLNQKHQLSSLFTGVWGLNIQRFSYEEAEVISFEDSQFGLTDAFASLFYEGRSGLTVHGGLRLNHHSEYGSKIVYNLNPSYLFDLGKDIQVKALASVATSYITPTGFQLYSIYGNTDLGPEESLNMEAGGSFYFKEKLTFNMVYFSREETEAIDFVSVFDEDGNYVAGFYQNIEGTRQVNGVETDIIFQASENISFAANYSYVTTDDLTSFYRIPKNKAGASVNYSLLDNTHISLSYNYTGDRRLFDYGSGEEVVMDSFGLLDLFVRHEFLNDKLRIYGSVNNMTDEDFIAIYGFTTRGRTYSVGINYQF